jgi:hypothetical protein
MSGLFRKGSMALLLLLVLTALPPAAEAQPFGGFSRFDGTHQYVRIPHHPSLNPTAAFTFEAWVSLSNPGGAGTCRSIAGKNWEQSWWIGICNVGSPAKPTLRSYLKGTTSQRNGGTIPGGLTHIAVVFNGTRRLHYINGEKVLDVPETGPLPANTSEMRIGSDVAWQISPIGDVLEVRLWSVGRTEAQIRSAINVPLTTAQPGLVGVWSMNGPQDSVGSRDGTTVGDLILLTTGVIPTCAGLGNATQLCLQNRFLVSVRWRTSPIGEPTDGSAQVVPVINPGSGIFWFFSPDNWEVMVKTLNGCGVNSRFWVFSASTTNLFYELYVFDVTAGVGKIYFNYPGPPAPAVTDTDAFGC